MGALANIYLKEEILETLLKTVRAKKEKGVSIAISINNETNDYGQNVSGYVSQTKEQRESKAKKFYVGNGSVVWTDGVVKVADKVDSPKHVAAQEEGLDLPF